MKNAKSTLVTGFLVLGLFMVGSLQAAEPEKWVKDFSLKDETINTLCPTSVFQKSFIWRGVTDMREGMQPKEIGRIAKKEVVKAEIVSSEPLAASFERDLQKLMQKCGAQWLSRTGSVANQAELRVELTEFHLGLEKKLLRGESEGKSRLRFLVSRGTQFQMIEVGYDLSGKRGALSGKKQAMKSLDELYEKLIEEVIRAGVLKEL